VKKASTRALVALILGGVLTLGALIGVFFWAAVPNFGYVHTAQRTDSVFYEGEFEQEISDAAYLANYVGFAVTAETPDGEVIGTITAADKTA